MKIKTKVLVVGGGPAGSTAASVLAKQGIEVLLLEKNFLFEKPCGGGISSVVFDEYRLHDEQTAIRVDKVTLVSPNNRNVEIDLNPDHIKIVDRQLFDTSLRKKAETDGAEVLEGHFIVAEKRKQFYVSTAIKESALVEIHSEFIIGADGVNSKVRISQGIKPQKALFTIVEKIDTLIANNCEFWFSSFHAPNFYSWVFPAHEGISLGTGSSYSKRLKYQLNSFKRRRGLQNYNGHSRIYRIPVWEGNLYNKGKILFAGDSAGQVMPMSFEGIYYAMKSGECAAEAVIKNNMRMYKKLWKSCLYKKFFLMSKLNTFFLNNDMNAEKLVSLHRNPEIQEASKALWLLKDKKSKSLIKYIKLLGKILV